MLLTFKKWTSAPLPFLVPTFYLTQAVNHTNVLSVISQLLSRTQWIQVYSQSAGTSIEINSLFHFDIVLLTPLRKPLLTRTYKILCITFRPNGVFCRVFLYSFWVHISLYFIKRSFLEEYLQSCTTYCKRKCCIAILKKLYIYLQ